MIKDTCGNKIVFYAKLDSDGVPWITEKMIKEAKRLAKLIGCKIIDFGGDFEETWFYLDREMTIDELEILFLG